MKFMAEIYDLGKLNIHSLKLSLRYLSRWRSDLQFLIKDNTEFHFHSLCIVITIAV